jgi:Group II intron, maturase-specific domain
MQLSCVAVEIPLEKALPDLAEELAHLLTISGHAALAEQVPGLKLLDRCRCGDDFCATFYTQPKPNPSYGNGHETIVLIGWANYFCLGPVSNAYSAVERHTCRRLRQWLRAKHNRQGAGTKRYSDQLLHDKFGLVRLNGRTVSFPWAKP